MAIRIASYNLWNGANQTYFRLVDFVKEQKFDVLCLQEINGWQNDDFGMFKDFADHASFTAYQYGNSNSEFKLGTFTTLPITAHNVHVEGFWHCVVEIHVEFNGSELVIVNLHLDPWKEEPRLHEVERLMELIDVSKPTIITGDFNSVSRHDNYPPEFLEQLKQRNFEKFGKSELDYRVTDFMESAGFVDVAANLKHMDITAPSAYDTGGKEETPVSEAPARVDYAFISPSLVPMVKEFVVLKNEQTDKISDHYPIVLTLDGKPDASKPAPAAPNPVSPPANPAPSEPTTPKSPESEPNPESKNTPLEGEIKLH